MNSIRKFAIGMSMLSADIILLSCCLYFTVIIQKMEQVYPNLLLWFLLTAAAFIFNLLLCRKQIQVGILCTCNLVWMVLSCIAVCLLFESEPTSLFMKVFICGAIIAIEGHSCYLALMPLKTDQCVLFLDVLVVVVALFLCGCQLRSLTGVLPLQILGFAVTGYTLAALIFLRTTPDHTATVQGGSMPGRAGVFALLGVIVAASCILCAALSLKAGAATQNLLSLFLTLLRSLKGGLQSIGQACTAFFMRFYTETDSSGIQPTQTSSSSSSSGDDWIPVPNLPTWLPVTIGVIAAALILFFILRALLRLRREKIRLPGSEYRALQVTRQAIPKRQDSLWKRLCGKLSLAYRMHRLRRTPAGLTVLARKKGKSLGIVMEKNETWHGYIKRLAPCGNTQVLLELAAFLEQYFYSGHPTGLSPEQYKIYSTSLRQMQHMENE